MVWMTSLQVCFLCALCAQIVVQALLLFALGLAVGLQCQDSHACYDAGVSSGCKVVSCHNCSAAKCTCSAPELLCLADSLLLEAVLMSTLFLIAVYPDMLCPAWCWILHSPACETAQRHNIHNKWQCAQVNGCAGPAKCSRKSSAKKGCPKPRSAPLAGRCRGVSWREAPRLCNVPFAQSGRAPSGAQPTALLGCMRFATDLSNFPH